MIVCPVCLSSPDPVDEEPGTRMECRCGAFQYEPGDGVWTFGEDRDSETWMSLQVDGTLWLVDHLITVDRAEFVRGFIDTIIVREVVDA